MTSKNYYCHTCRAARNVDSQLLCSVCRSGFVEEAYTKPLSKPAYYDVKPTTPKDQPNKTGNLYPKIPQSTNPSQPPSHSQKPGSSTQQQPKQPEQSRTQPIYPVPRGYPVPFTPQVVPVPVQYAPFLYPSPYQTFPSPYQSQPLYPSRSQAYRSSTTQSVHQTQAHPYQQPLHTQPYPVPYQPTILPNNPFLPGSNVGHATSPAPISPRQATSPSVTEPSPVLLDQPCCTSLLQPHPLLGPTQTGPLQSQPPSQLTPTLSTELPKEKEAIVIPQFSPESVMPTTPSTQSPQSLVRLLPVAPNTNPFASHAKPSPPQSALPSYAEAIQSKNLELNRSLSESESEKTPLQSHVRNSTPSNTTTASSTATPSEPKEPKDTQSNSNKQSTPKFRGVPDTPPLLSRSEEKGFIYPIIPLPERNTDGDQLYTLDTLMHFSADDYEKMQVQAEPVYEKFSSAQVKKVPEVEAKSVLRDSIPFNNNQPHNSYSSNNNNAAHVADSKEKEIENEKEEKEKASSEQKTPPINPINELGFFGAMGNIMGQFQEKGVGAGLSGIADVLDELSYKVTPTALNKFRYYYGAPPTAVSARSNLDRVDLSEEPANGCFCLEDWNADDDARKMPCGHVFHYECLIQWLELRNSCPICRVELPTDDRRYERYKEHKT